MHPSYSKSVSCGKSDRSCTLRGGYAWYIVVGCMILQQTVVINQGAQGVLYSWILATFRVIYLKNMGMHITTLASDQSSDLAILYILHR